MRKHSSHASLHSLAAARENARQQLGGSPRSNRRRLSVPNQKKSLSFSEDLCKLHMVECLANTSPDAKNAIWYDGKELGGMRKKEIKKVKHAQIMAGQGNSIETEDMTWRGFEDIQGHWCRVEKSAEYTTAVVKHYHSQVNQGYFDADELKRIAKGLSKTERSRARNLAVKDAEAVGMPGDRKGRIRKSNSSVNTLTMAGGLKKNASSSGLRRIVSSGAGLSRGLSRAISSKSLKLGKFAGGKSSDGSGSKASNFQWGVKKNGADVTPSASRMAVLSA